MYKESAQLDREAATLRTMMKKRWISKCKQHQRLRGTEAPSLPTIPEYSKSEMLTFKITGIRNLIRHAVRKGILSARIDTVKGTRPVLIFSVNENEKAIGPLKDPKRKSKSLGEVERELQDINKKAFLDGSVTRLMSKMRESKCREFSIGSIQKICPKFTKMIIRSAIERNLIQRNETKTTDKESKNIATISYSIKERM